MLDRDVYATGAGEGELLDIWDGEVLRNFCGPDGKNFFTCKGPSDIRLAFSICMDNLNPFFNKHGGKSYSVGTICLICHNLPPDIRYNLEYVFIFCVFPGPREPRLEQLNNVLKFVVDLFCDFWDPGVYYSSTKKYPNGRLAQAAIVLLLGDLMAVKKLSGIGKWCTQCPVEAKDIDNLDPETWPAPRTAEEHRRLAIEWKGLDSAAQVRHFNKYGIRWTELLRLPYFDAVRFTAVELSHNLLTNNADHHLRVIWDMNALLPDGLGDTGPSSSKKKEDLDPVRVQHAWEMVMRGTDKQLGEIRAKYLKECCRMAGEGTGGRKAALYKTLLEWV